jgi:hypothetical protein
MNRSEFDAFIGEAKARGFSHVLTGAGPIPLDRWRPYGCFDVNPGIEKHIEGFTWTGHNTARDGTPQGRTVVGVWTFTTQPEEEATTCN